MNNDDEWNIRLRLLPRRPPLIFPPASLTAQQHHASRDPDITPQMLLQGPDLTFEGNMSSENRRVQFEDQVCVVPVDCFLDDCECRSLFYCQDDFKRFRNEIKKEKLREARKNRKIMCQKLQARRQKVAMSA